MDEEDAEGVLLEWITFLAQAILSGTVDPGGEITTDLTSSGGRAYHVHVSSAVVGAKGVQIIGQITTTDTDPAVTMEQGASFERPDPEAADDP